MSGRLTWLHRYVRQLGAATNGTPARANPTSLPATATPEPTPTLDLATTQRSALSACAPFRSGRQCIC